MNFFRRYALLCMMMMVSAVALAIPAKPGLTRKIQLSDGTSITARLTGDEHAHYWLGDDGKAYTLTDDKAQQIDVEAVKTRALARRSQANARRAKRLAPQKVGEIGNYIGQKKGIIILVNFSNVSFKSENNNALYQRIANEKNFSYGNFKGSMYDYFYAQSDGQFELTFDVVGPVTVSNTQSYYGSNDSQGSDKHPATMVIEALKKADSEVNFADYDWDGDGEVDQVYVVYAGKGEADGGASTTIWPHEWQLSSAASYGDGSGVQTLDGVKIDTYACGGELDGQTGSIAGIGTMCHEFSHCLGYPDFYDTDYSGGQGMFEWDLMDSGSYNDDGYRPAGYTSYERWVAGWRTPVELTSTTQVNNMPALTENNATSYIIYNNGNRNEYFLLENRQKTGWDASIPGAGLLILHVDYSASAWSSNTPNDTPSHQRMTWVAADNQYQYTTYQGTKYYTTEGAANDPFPYGSVNAFNKSTTPAAQLYNKNTDGTYYLDSSVEEITQDSNGTISFKFVGVSNVATPVFSPSGGRYAEAQTVTITCATAGATIHYTLDGSAPTTASAVYTSPLTISETTTVKAIAVSDGEDSATATAKYTIGDALIYESLSGYNSEEDSTSELGTNSESLDFDGWTSFTKVFAGSVSNAYAEGGCFKLGSSKGTGSMTASNLSLSGNATLTFYLKKYSSDTGKLNVTVTGATADVTSFTPSSEWTLCTVNLTNANGAVTITLATSSKRAYVDEIEITTQQGITPTIPDPLIVANEALNFIAQVGASQTLELEVLSEGLTEDIALTLSDANNVFSLGAATISRTASEEGTTVSVTFAPTQVGTFTATVTLTSAGADPVTVSLSGTATEATTPVEPIEGEPLLYESLSGYNSSSDSSTALETNSNNLDYSEWTAFTKVFAGGTSNAYTKGGCLKLGTSSAKGSMTASNLSLNGNATLTFYLKKYGTDTGNLNVTVTGATADVTSFTPSSEWTLCTVNLTNITGAVTITLATSSKRAYLDEIKVLTADSGETPDPIVDSNHYTLVSDASTLAAGDKIVIAYINAEEETYYALSTTQNNNNRAATSDVTLNGDGTLTAGEEVQIITLEKEGDNFLFNVGDGYLYAASSTKNYLKTETTADDNAKATITIDGASATIVFQGANTRNVMRYNPDVQNGVANYLFSCYSSTSAVGGKPKIYRKVKQTTPSVVGDVNRDGQVSIADVTALVNIILGKDSTVPYQYDHDAADVNTDGGISIADVTALVNSILGKDENQ